MTLPPPDLQFLSFEDKMWFSWLILQCCYLHMRIYTETSNFSQNQGLALLLWPSLEMNFPVLTLLGQLSHPPELHLSSSPQLFARHMLSLGILSTHVLSRAFVHCEYHVSFFFFPPLCCSSSYSLSLYAAVDLFLIHIWLAYLLWTCFTSFQHENQPRAPLCAVPRAKLSWLCRSPEDCQQHRLSVWYNKQMVPFQPEVRRHNEDRLLKTCWLLRDKNQEDRHCTAPAHCPSVQTKQGFCGGRGCRGARTNKCFLRFTALLQASCYFYLVITYNQYSINFFLFLLLVCGMIFETILAQIQ